MHNLKERITVTIDNEVLKIIDKKVKQHIFANRSHGFEFLIADKILQEKKEQEEEMEE